MPLTAHGFTADDVHAKVKLLIDNLVNIKDDTGAFLLKLDDGRVIDTKSWHGWEWTHGVGLYGLWKYYTLTGDAATLKTMQDWFAVQLAEGTTKNINTVSLLPRRPRQDECTTDLPPQMAPFLTLAYLYEETGDKTYLPYLDSWAEWAMHDLRRTPYGGMQHVTYASDNTNELWDDTLMMTVLPLAKIGQLLGRPEYIEEAKRQFLTHIQFLFDPATGLWFHGWKFDDGAAPGALGHNFARARWARGNSWVTIVIPEFIELLALPPGDALRAHLLNVFEAQCRALAALQGDDGLWRTLLDVPAREGSYAEASATAGFAYGMLKAARKRYVGREYEAVALKALKAVMGKIDASGELRDVSFGTGMGHDLQHYKDIPLTSMPYGQAMAMMLLGEFLWTFT